MSGRKNKKQKRKGNKEGKGGIVYNWKSPGNWTIYKWSTCWYSGRCPRLVSLESFSWGICDSERNCNGPWLRVISSGQLDHFTQGQLTSGWTGPSLPILSFLLGLLSEVLVWTLSHCCSPFFVTSLVSEDLHGRCWTISQAFVLSSGLPEVKLASLKENDNNLSKARDKPKGELSHLVDS